ncbi:hypothetical protein BY458DRAFT_491233 [Sporodiniella umbellata]|nr:hypothetical protein BY458DRAFT_491233 [Sporodiniella umbellata]
MNPKAIGFFFLIYLLPEITYNDLRATYLSFSTLIELGKLQLSRRIESDIVSFKKRPPPDQKEMIVDGDCLEIDGKTQSTSYNFYSMPIIRTLFKLTLDGVHVTKVQNYLKLSYKKITVFASSTMLATCITHIYKERKGEKVRTSYPEFIFYIFLSLNDTKYKYFSWLYHV